MNTKLSLRQRALHERLSQRRQNRLEQRAPQENVDGFWTELRTCCSNAQTIDDVSTAQTLVSKSSYFLPRYDLKKALEMVSDIDEKLKQAKKIDQPKPKFSFNKKTLCEKHSEKNHRSESTQNHSESQKQFNQLLADMKPDEIRLHNHVNDIVYRAPGSLLSSVVCIAHAKQSSFSLCDAIGAVRIDEVKDCKVLIGPVAGSIFIQNARNCVFVLASRQIRIHDCIDCDFYLLAASNPIIENCSNVRVAPYNFEYSYLDEHKCISGIDCITENLWDQVKDFGWLRTQHSPNWSEIPMAERKEKFVPILAHT